MAKEAPKKNDAVAADEAKPKGKGKKLLLIIVATVVVVVIGAGAALFLLAGKDGGENKDTRAHAAKAPVFVNLEPFTVNLQPENGEQYLQVVTTLKITDKSAEEQIKMYMPEMRHRILLLLSGKKPSEIGTPEGRELLADQIRDEVNRILGSTGAKALKASAPAKPIGKTSARTAADAHGGDVSGPVSGVLFTSFIVQ